MWLALPGQVLRLFVVAFRGAWRCRSLRPCLLPIADTRVHAVVAAFQFVEEGVEATTGVTGNRRERRGDRDALAGTSREAEMKRSLCSARQSVRSAGTAALSGTLHALRRVGRVATRWCGFVVAALVVAVLLPPGEGGALRRMRVRRSENRLHSDARTTLASVHCHYLEASIPASPNPHPLSRRERGLQAKPLRSCSTSGTRADASLRGSG
jgi:hypothetical protein